VHLRYLQRDGVTRDGSPGTLYSATADRADGRAVLDRSEGDPRQFRLIVAAEDGAELSDLSVFTRNLMRQVERDLGTGLDWRAVDHFNTGHSPTPILIRGVDEVADGLGEGVVVALADVAHRGFDPGLHQAFGVSGSTGLAGRRRSEGRDCPAGADSAGSSASSTKPARAEPGTSHPTMHRAEAWMMTTAATRSCQVTTQVTSASHQARDQQTALQSWNRSGCARQPGGIPTTCPTWDHEIGAGPGPSGRGCRGSTNHGVGR